MLVLICLSTLFHENKIKARLQLIASIKMPSSHILPITNPHLHRSSKTLALDPKSAPTPTMFLKQDLGDDPSTKLLISSPFDDETTISMKPLLSKTSSFVGSNSNSSASPTSSSPVYYQQRRRRVNSDSSLSSHSEGSGRGQTLADDMGHAASETFLITRLSLKLLKYLGYVSLIDCCYCCDLIDLMNSVVIQIQEFGVNV